MYISGGINCGWTFYVPLSYMEDLNGSVDYMFISLHLVGLASVIGSMNFVVSVFSRFGYVSVFDVYFAMLSLPLLC